MDALEDFIGAPLTASRIAEAVKKFGEGAVNDFLDSFTSPGEGKLPDFSKMTDTQVHAWFFDPKTSKDATARMPSKEFSRVLRESQRQYREIVEGSEPDSEEEIYDRMRLGERF